MSADNAELFWKSLKASDVLTVVHPSCATTKTMNENLERLNGNVASSA